MDSGWRCDIQHNDQGCVLGILANFYKTFYVPNLWMFVIGNTVGF